MKAQLYDEIVTLVAFQNDDGILIPRGTRGTVVEVYRQPLEGYAVDLALPDNSLVGGHSYENVILYPHQFALTANIEESQGIEAKR